MASHDRIHSTTPSGADHNPQRFSTSVKSDGWKQDVEACLDGNIPPNSPISCTSSAGDLPPERGDLCLLPVPFTDGSGCKIRPALVLATKGANLIVAPVSSQPLGDEFDVPISAWAESGLDSQSKVQCAGIMPIAHSLVVKHIGGLLSEDWERVLNSIARWFKTRLLSNDSV
jgi:mRNA-degrading endonuclease toxin of MazEF toxin-antitoxin module